MTVNNLIQSLSLFSNKSGNIMAYIGNNNQQLMYVDIFAKMQNFPALMLSEEKPLHLLKTYDTLLEELKIWGRNDERRKLEIYLVTIFEYKDESYDFRYFMLESVKENRDIILASSNKECIELREHFKAFDDSMYAD